MVALAGAGEKAAALGLFDEVGAAVGDLGVDPGRNCGPRTCG
jgi:hypothetical protein